ncbi:MAG TPA: hypothetical protein DEQ30_09595 [Porphyromonadaceae bacterium]|nr:hypothetical protein [Porphyromonadaceae bacterium]
MKKTILLSAIISFCLFSCTNDDDLKEYENNVNTNEKGFTTFKNGVTLQNFDDDTYIFQGDILLSKKEAESLVLFSDLPQLEARGTDDNSLYWSNGIIPYTFAPDLPETLKTRILDAMSDWESNTPIRFVQRTNQSKYVSIVVLDDSDTAGGYSTLGCVSNAKIKLKSTSSYSLALHELGHTIGLIHEYERADRDDHIKIIRDEITDEFKYAFDPRRSIHSVHPFDFRSIMIYSSTDFQKEKNATITTFDDDSFDWRGTLSPLDIEIVNYIYNNMQYYSVLLPKGFEYNRVENYITYPKSVRLGNNVIITVKAKAITAPIAAIRTYNFSNPSNGTLVSSDNNVMSGNSKIKIQEFIFKPNRTGELRIKCDELSNNYVLINVYQ